MFVSFASAMSLFRLNGLTAGVYRKNKKHSDPLLAFKHPHLQRSLSKSGKRQPWHRRKCTIVGLVIFMCWSLLTADSFFLWWLRWTLSGGPAQADPLLTRDCPARNYSLPLIVVVPLISSQLLRLEWNLARWGEPALHPCPKGFAGRKPHLSFYFDRPLNEKRTQAAAHAIRELLNQPPLYEVMKQCFDGVSIQSANMTESETHNSYTMDLIHNLVQTGGSNRLYEKSFATYGGGRFRHMFWMEPDAYPIRKGWLNAVVDESTWGDFWMRGSTMRHDPRFNIGMEPFRSRYQRHLNGNGIYALDDPCFARYRQLTRLVYGNGAFDVAMNLYLLGIQRILTFQTVGHRFQQSRVIADVGVTMVDIEKLPEKFPGTFLIHGKAGFVRFPMVNFMQY